MSRCSAFLGGRTFRPTYNGVNSSLALPMRFWALAVGTDECYFGLDPQVISRPFSTKGSIGPSMARLRER